MMKKVLITGASGFLGKALVERFSPDHEVIGVGHEHAGSSHRRVDLRDTVAFKKTLEEVRPDIVVHAAAYRDPDFCEEHPDEARRLNVAPAQVLRDALPAETRLVFISSDYVFDGEHPPYRETSARNPINVYGQTKCEAEDCLRDRDNTIILRVPVLVGAGPTLEQSGFIAQILRAVTEKKALELDDVGVRFPLWIRDVADAVHFLLGRKACGIFHLSGPRGATRYGWVVEMAKILGISHDHIRPSATLRQKAERPKNSQLATDKIQALGYHGASDFAEVFRGVVKGFERFEK